MAEVVIFGDAPVLMPFVVLMEVEYKFLREMPESTDEQMAALHDWPVSIIDSHTDWRRAAARIKAEGKVSFADAWVASLALMHDAELVHKDPEFDSLVGLKSLRLPYNRPGRGSSGA